MGAGFVGFHAALALKKRGDGVLGIDNFNSYYPTGIKRDRAETLEKAGVLTLDMDLNDGDRLRKLMAECKFTHVLALAAQAGVRYATKHPHSYVSSNIAGFVELLEVARTVPDPKPRVVYASSSSVYGLNTKVPFSETDAVDQPASLYAATKKAECHVVNLGNKDPVTVSYLVECIEAALGKKAVRNYMPMPPTGDVLKTNADVTLAAKELGYAPTTPLKEGIEKFIDWYQEYYKNGMDKEMAEYVPM